MNSRAIRTFASTLALLAGATPALAELNVFTNATGNNSWYFGANWSLGHIPTLNDDAIIPAGFGPIMEPGSSAQIRSLTVHGALYMQAGIYCSNGFSVTGQLSIYSSGANGPFLSFRGQGTVDGTISIANGTIADANFNDTDATLTINPGGKIECLQPQLGFASFIVDTNNYGTINMWGPRLEFTGTSTATRTLNNYGTFNNLGGANITAWGQNGRTLIFNYGTWKHTQAGAQSIASNIIFTNENFLHVDRADLTIHNLINVHTSNMTLGGGAWHMTNGGRLRTAEGRSISKIGANAQVVLLGPGAGFDALYPCTELEGFLSIGDGADLTLYPPQVGTVIQRGGDLIVGAGSHLYIQGAFWQQCGRINRVYQDATEAGSGIFDVLLSSTFSGSLFCQFLDESAVQVGAEFPVVQMAPNACCGVNGPFADFQAVGQGANNIALRYDNDRIYVTAVCPADFDGDGFLTGLDFDAYVQAFETGETAADFDHDGFISGVDYDLYVESFEGGC